MRIRLFSERFGGDEWELELSEQGLLFRRGEEKLLIPYENILHFRTEGQGRQLKRFFIETVKERHEGVFLENADADRVVEALRAHSGCYVDIRLDARD